MKSLGEDTVRGGQTVFHGIRMWSQLARAGLLVVVALTVTVPLVRVAGAHFGYDTYAVAMLTLAEFKLAMGYAADYGQEVRLENGDTVVAEIADIAAYRPWIAVRQAMSDGLKAGMWLGARMGGGIVLGMLLWFRWRGSRLKRRKRPARRGTRHGPSAQRAHRAPAGGGYCGRWPVRPHPTGSRACRTRTAPRPSTRSSRAPPAQARRC